MRVRLTAEQLVTWEEATWPERRRLLQALGLDPAAPAQREFGEDEEGWFAVFLTGTTLSNDVEPPQ